MDEISRALPELLWLDRMPVSGANITLSGRAFNSNAVANFIENLDRVPEFEEPVLRDLQERGPVYAYTIGFDYSYQRPATTDGASEAAAPIRLDITGDHHNLALFLDRISRLLRIIIARNLHVCTLEPNGQTIAVNALLHKESRAAGRTNGRMPERGRVPQVATATAAVVPTAGSDGDLPGRAPTNNAHAVADTRRCPPAPAPAEDGADHAWQIIGSVGARLASSTYQSNCN